MTPRDHHSPQSIEAATVRTYGRGQRRPTTQPRKYRGPAHLTVAELCQSVTQPRHWGFALRMDHRSRGIKGRLAACLVTACDRSPLHHATRSRTAQAACGLWVNCLEQKCRPRAPMALASLIKERALLRQRTVCAVVRGPLQVRTETRSLTAPSWTVSTSRFAMFLVERIARH